MTPSSRRTRSAQPRRDYGTTRRPSSRARDATHRDPTPVGANDYAAPTDAAAPCAPHGIGRVRTGVDRSPARPAAARPASPRGGTRRRDGRTQIRYLPRSGGRWADRAPPAAWQRGPDPVGPRPCTGDSASAVRRLQRIRAASPCPLRHRPRNRAVSSARRAAHRQRPSRTHLNPLAAAGAPPRRSIRAVAPRQAGTRTGRPPPSRRGARPWTGCPSAPHPPNTRRRRPGSGGGFSRRPTAY